MQISLLVYCSTFTIFSTYRTRQQCVRRIHLSASQLKPSNDLRFLIRRHSSSAGKGSKGPDGASFFFCFIPTFCCSDSRLPACAQQQDTVSIYYLSFKLAEQCPLCMYLNVCAVPLQAPTLTMEGGRLKRSLQLMPGRDFETVPEPVWRALYHWYGANLSLPRPVSEYCTYTPQLMSLTISVMQVWTAGNIIHITICF